MIKVDYEICQVSGDAKLKFSSKEALYKWLKTFLKLSTYRLGSGPYHFEKNKKRPWSW